MQISYLGTVFVVMFRALSEADQDAVREMLDRLSRSDIANDNAPVGLRDFLTD